MIGYPVGRYHTDFVDHRNLDNCVCDLELAAIGSVFCCIVR